MAGCTGTGIRPSGIRSVYIGDVFRLVLGGWIGMAGRTGGIFGVNSIYYCRDSTLMAGGTIHGQVGRRIYPTDVLNLDVVGVTLQTADIRISNIGSVMERRA